MKFGRASIVSFPMAILAMIAISGCASMSSMYSTCDQKSDKFSAVAACTKTALKADSRYGFHNGYIAYANRVMAAMDVMEEKVAAGSMTEKEARYNMQEILASMQREVAAEVNAMNASMPVNKTVRTNCTSYGSNVSCTSR
jgi:hypothetical protein